MTTIRRHAVPADSYDPKRPLNDLMGEQLAHFAHVADTFPAEIREKLPPVPAATNMKPSWLTVEYARTFFRSVWANAMNAAASAVSMPTVDTTIRMPPVDDTRLGYPRASIQRTMSSMWMHISPTMPFPYSMNARQLRG